MFLSMVWHYSHGGNGSGSFNNGSWNHIPARKVVERHHTGDEPKLKAFLYTSGDLDHDCLLAVVNRGYAEDVIDAARQAGATGATIFHGRGTGDHQAVILPIINMNCSLKKEIVCLITGIDISTNVANSLLKDEQLV